MYINIDSGSNIIFIVIVGFAYGLIVVDVVARAFDKKASKLILVIGGIVSTFLFMKILNIF